MFRRLGRLWELGKDIGDVLWPMRFSLFVLVAVWLLFGLEQSQDALLALVDDGSVGWAQALFIAAVFVWAFQTLYWARFMSRLPIKNRPPRLYPPLLDPTWFATSQRELPRWLGLAAIAVVGLKTWFATRGYSQHGIAITLITATMGAVFYALAWSPAYLRSRKAGEPRRNAFAQARAENSSTLHPPPPAQLRSSTEVTVIGFVVATLVLCFLGGKYGEAADRTIAVILAVMWLLGGVTLCLRTAVWLPLGTRIILAANFAAVQLLFGLSLYAEWVVSWGLTAPVIVMSAAAAWVFAGTFFIALPAERYGLPVLTALVALGIVLSLTSGHDNHDIRTLTPLAETPLSVEQTFAIWHDQAEKAWSARGGQGAVPLVIVATAGGASRAGYWTSQVLGRIEDRYPDFHQYVFAISSVSGGSLGAAVWRSLLDVAGPPATANAPGFATCGRAYFRQDFLSPVFFTGLYADLTQRFLPGRLLPDRATTLEKSWEEAWAHIMAKDDARNGFRTAFHALAPRPEKPWAPLLFINGTSEATGRRILTAPVRIGRDEFPDAIGFFDKIAVDLRVSTAVHNSARFPYIDAAGNIWDRSKNDADAHLVDRIVDGGYFENFGAGTAYDLLQTLINIAGGKFRPVIIQISSDPDFRGDEERYMEVWSKPLSGWLDLASDVLTPPIAFWQTRDGVGYRATQVMKRRIEEGKSPTRLMAQTGASEPAVPVQQLYLSFRLINQAGRREPMSWALSTAALDAFDQEWDSTENSEERRKLEQILWPNGVSDLPSYVPACRN